MAGFVGVPDEWFREGSPFWLLPADERALLLTLYGIANRRAGAFSWMGVKVLVRRGELVRSEDEIARLMGGWTRRRVRTAMAGLEASGFLATRLMGWRRSPVKPEGCVDSTESGYNQPVKSGSERGQPNGRRLRVITLRDYYGSEDEAGAGGQPNGQPKSPGVEKTRPGTQTKDREEDHAAQQGDLLSPPAQSPFARFVSETWPDVTDPSGLERKLAAAFPGVDLETQARRAALWEEERASRRKKNHASFLRKWLGNARPDPRDQAPPVERRRVVVGWDRDNRPIYKADAR